MTEDYYGMNLNEPLASLNQDGLWEKMSEDSSQQKTVRETKEEHSPELFLSFPVGGIVLNGKLYQQARLVPRTLEKESSSWETPNTMDHLEPRTGKALENALYRGDKQKKSMRKSTGNLRENQKLWSTPRASQASKPINKKAPSVKKGKHGSTLEMDMGEQNHSLVGKRLNSKWVSLLMGFPKDWQEK